MNEVARIRRDVALQIGDGLHDGLRRGEKSGPPARHAIRLRQRTNQNRPRLHFRNELHDVVMDRRRIDQLVIAFVEDANEIVFHREARDFFKHVRRIDNTCRIVRRVENDSACSRGDAPRKLVNVDLKIVVNGRQENRRRTRQANLFWQCHPIRRWDDDFVAGLEDHKVRVEQRLFRSGGETDFIRCIGRAGFLRNFLGKPFAQFADAQRVGILRSARINRFSRRRLDAGTRVFVQFARREVDDVNSLGAEFARAVAHP